MVQTVFGKVVTNYSFRHNQVDHTFFIHAGNDKIVILIGYADDIVLTSNDEARLGSLKEKLANEF